VVAFEELAWVVARGVERLAAGVGTRVVVKVGDALVIAEIESENTPLARAVVLVPFSVPALVGCVGPGKLVLPGYHPTACTDSFGRKAAP
jgi:hypothetical protein